MGSISQPAYLEAHGLVVQSWQPAVGDWVRVERAPECRASHSFERYGTVAYGRVEAIDRTMGGPESWRQAFAADDEDGDPEQMARDHLGHDYLVQDVLDTGRVIVLDGYYCALELTPVDEATARAGIAMGRLLRSALGSPSRGRSGGAS